MSRLCDSAVAGPAECGDNVLTLNLSPFRHITPFKIYPLTRNDPEILRTRIRSF